jgi:DNA repair protein RadC
MKELAPCDRPREKLERAGVSALGDNELLALVLGSGSRREGVLALATRLLASVGGLHRLPRATVSDLRGLPGMGRARSAQVLAAVELGRRSCVRSGTDQPRVASPRQLAGLLLPQFGSGAVERFGVVLLDTKHRVIRATVLSVGSLDATVVHPREVFREAASASAAAIVLFHNHPSGDPTPSPDDLALTSRLIQAGDIMGIAVVDHLILADDRYISLLEAGRFGASPVAAASGVARPAMRERLWWGADGC